MVRSKFKSVFTVCMILAAGYATYIPFEKIRAAEAEAAKQRTAINALLSDDLSPVDESSSAAKSASMKLNDERTISPLTDLNEKSI